MSENAERRGGVDLVAPSWWGAKHRYEARDTGYSTPCWVWLLSTTEKGYGRVGTRGGRQLMAHNLYWERAHGPVPQGLELDHLCRVPGCVNPEHLEPVTRSENLRRRLRPHALTAPDVLAIRASAEPGDALAKRFGVTTSTISHVRLGRTWAHLGGITA